MSISVKELAILKLLVSADNNKRNPEMYGLDMIKESNGILKQGTIYVILSKMEDEGYLTSRLEDSVLHYNCGNERIPRRLYKVTEKGKQILAFTEGAIGQLKPAL